MREKKGGALQKLKKRLSHSFGRLSKSRIYPRFIFNCAWVSSYRTLRSMAVDMIIMNFVFVRILVFFNPIRCKNPHYTHTMSRQYLVFRHHLRQIKHHTYTPSFLKRPSLTRIAK